MTIYKLEMRNTERWDDVRYRDYTSSEARKKRFEKVPKIQFTDSGHGMVPSVTEVRSRRKDTIKGHHTNESHVREHGGA